MKQQTNNGHNLGQHFTAKWFSLPKRFRIFIIWSGLIILGYLSGKHIWY